MGQSYPLGGREPEPTGSHPLTSNCALLLLLSAPAEGAMNDMRIEVQPRLTVESPLP